MAAADIGIIFHGIGAPARELEPGEAEFWIDADRFERILDRIAAAPDTRRIHVSFDDGNLSDHDIALPRLVARGLSADFFVLTGRIGAPGSLDAEKIRAIEAAGMTIGSHGIAHLNWAHLDDSALMEELTRSRANLETICRAPVTAAGIPFGGYSRRVLRALRKAGYRCAYSSDGGRMNPAAYLRPRTSVRAGMSDAEIDAILAGRMTPLRRMRRRLGMLRKRLPGL